jgi:hypothetical protein
MRTPNELWYAQYCTNAEFVVPLNTTVLPTPSGVKRKKMLVASGTHPWLLSTFKISVCSSASVRHAEVVCPPPVT